MVIKEIPADESRYWIGRRLSEAPPFKVRWASIREWTNSITSDKAEHLPHFLTHDDRLTCYSVLEEAVRKIKSESALKRLGGGAAFYEEKYLLGDAVVTYIDQHTFGKNGILAITLETAEKDDAKKLAAYLGLPFD